MSLLLRVYFRPISSPFADGAIKHSQLFSIKINFYTLDIFLLFASYSIILSSLVKTQVESSKVYVRKLTDMLAVIDSDLKAESLQNSLGAS